MESHRYNFSLKDLLTSIGLPLFGLFGCALAIHALVFTNMLPAPHPAADADTTYFKYKSKLARSGHRAKIILTGDSSCTTGLDSLLLSASLTGNPKVVNLGLIIGLKLDHYRNILETTLENAAEEPSLVILLVTPQFLSGTDANPDHIATWEKIHARHQDSGDPEHGSSAEDLLGLPEFKNRILAYGLNVPLKGSGASYYGFTSSFLSYLESHNGSFVDPGIYVPPVRKQSVHYTLSPLLQSSSEAFRKHLPQSLKLAVGITPVPESHINASFEAQQHQLLAAWNHWLQADFLLTNLPARLPDGLFATGAHLNRRGQIRYTKLLAQQIREIGQEAN